MVCKSTLLLGEVRAGRGGGRDGGKSSLVWKSVDAQLIFSFQVQPCHLLVMVGLVREGLVSGWGRGAGVARGEERAERPFEDEEPDLWVWWDPMLHQMKMMEISCLWKYM